MKKRLRLRISRVISSFQSCRSKDETSALPPVFCLSPINPKRFDIDFPTPPPPPRPSPSRRLAPVVSAAAGCRCAPGRPSRRNLYPAADTDADDLPHARETPAYLWRKEEKWHVVACAEEFQRRKIHDSDDSDFFPPAITRMAARRKKEMEIRRRRRMMRKSRSRARISTSSVDSSWFSSEDEENDEREEEDDDNGDETDTLISSRSFTTDSSAKHCPSPETKSAAGGMLRRLVPCSVEEGKVKESFAVVKRSEDPQGDFRRSMAEMVVEKGIYDAADLEQLLHCFLSLNSRDHHRAIVSAFSDIWEALFPETSPHINY